MKRFDFKNPRTQRWFLLCALVVSTGFNLNWSPENTLIAKNEYRAFSSGQVELASSTKYVEVDLKEFDKDLDGIKLKAALNGEGTRGTYTVEGNVCGTCVGIQEIPIEKKDVEQIEYLKMKFAKHAMEQIKEKNALEKGKKEKKKKSRRYESECDGELEDGGLIDCQKEEFMALVEKCDEDDMKKSERSKCLSVARDYFNREMKRNIGKGLAADTGSDLYTEAVEVRDSLISDLPSSMTDSIRKQLVGFSAAGIFVRSQFTYNKVLRESQNPGYAASEAKKRLGIETDNIGFPLYQSLVDFGAENDNQVTFQRMYSDSFQQPLAQFFARDHQNGIEPSEWTSFQSTTASGGDIGINPVDPNNVPTGLYQPRSTGNNQRGNGLQPPGAFGNENTNNGPGYPNNSAPYSGTPSIPYQGNDLFQMRSQQ